MSTTSEASAKQETVTRQEGQGQGPAASDEAPKMGGKIGEQGQEHMQGNGEETQAAERPAEEATGREEADGGVSTRANRDSAVGSDSHTKMVSSTAVPADDLSGEKMVRYVDTDGIHDVKALQAELKRVQQELRIETVRATRAEEVERRVKAELDEAQKLLDEAIDGSQDDVSAELRKQLEASREQLADANRKLVELQDYTDHIDEEYTMLQRRVNNNNQSPAPAGLPPGSKVLRMLEDKNKLIQQLQARIALADDEGHSQSHSHASFERNAREDGVEGAQKDMGEIPFDVLDRLDDELANAREQLLHKDAAIEKARERETELREELKQAYEWKERAVQAQQASSVVGSELKGVEREIEEERSMRRALEARFDEKLKLKVRELEGLTSEMMRLKKAGEQLAPVLHELECVKADARGKLEQRDKEVRRLQSGLAMADADKQKAEGRLNALQAEMAQWEVKVKNSEEVRWRAGMNLAKAKAEMDWRMKADQEKDFFLERMKDELERLKNKLMRVEMRKLKVEESLEEAVLELRSKKREMEHIKARVEGLVRSVQQKELGRRGPNAFISDGDRGRMHHELYPR